MQFKRRQPAGRRRLQKVLIHANSTVKDFTIIVIYYFKISLSIGVDMFLVGNWEYSIYLTVDFVFW